MFSSNNDTLELSEILNYDSEIKIYTDYSFLQESSISDHCTNDPVKQEVSHWGLHSFKLVERQNWDRAIAQAANIIADYHPYLPDAPEYMTAAQACGWRDGLQGVDLRPRVYCNKLKQWVLVDSGAAVTVWPKTLCPPQVLDHNAPLALEAVNKTKLPTFGKMDIAIRIGRKTYNHRAVIADVEYPILGWDFVRHYKFSLQWNRFGDIELVDRKSNIRSPLQMKAVPHGTLLALCPTGKPPVHHQFKTYQQWAKVQEQKIEKTQVPVPTKYREILNWYPSVLKPNFTSDNMKHGIIRTT